jgi:D123
MMIMPPPSSSSSSTTTLDRSAPSSEEEEQQPLLRGEGTSVLVGGAVGDDNDGPSNDAPPAAAAAAASGATSGMTAAAAAGATGRSPSAELTVGDDGDDDNGGGSGDDADNNHSNDDIEGGPPPVVVLLPSLREVLECQISSWYPAFARGVEDGDDDDDAAAASERRHRSPTGGDGVGGGGEDNSGGAAARRKQRRRRKRLTIRTVLVDVPDSFVASYLQSGNTVRLPPGSATSSILRTGPSPLRNPDGDDDDSDDSAWSSDASQPEDAPPNDRHGSSELESGHPNYDDGDELAALDQRIRAAIDELGGSVLPKLNWSAPKDAAWINAGSLQCQTPGDIYLLLQSSDFVSYDVHHALQDVASTEEEEEEEEGICSGAQREVATFSGYQLALRKWCHLYPSQEFRCFVKNRTVVAISQRHSTSHFPHLVQQQDRIRQRLVDFHDEYVKNRFAVNHQQCGDPVVSNYVLDAYIDQHDKVWIVDFNVWGSRTDPLLFTWRELERMDTHDEKVAVAAMRVVETPKQVRHDPLSSYRAPIDAVHVASLTGGGGFGGMGGARAFEEFAKLCRRPHDGQSASSSEEDEELEYEDGAQD